jgi:hypothetical protein
MPRDYDQTARALIDGAEKAVAAAVAPLLKRIEELEARELPQGERGDKGDQGENGANGADGSDGVGLASALINRDGQFVVTTTDGKSHELGVVVGRDGADGANGKNGANGTDGRDGLGLASAIIDKEDRLVVTMTDGSIKDLGIVVGRDGKDGINGKDGEPGRDGVNGERGEKGDTGEAGRDGQDAYPGEPKGLYDPSGEYRARDVVALNGNGFMAKRDNPGECPGDGWMVLAQRGKRGEQGDRGERGEEGKAGKDGAEAIEIHLDADTMTLKTVLSDGNILETDLQPFAEAIIQAVKE